MRSKRKTLVDFLNHEEVWIFCCSFVIAVALLFIHLAGDDPTHSDQFGRSFSSWLALAIEIYHTTTSRVLVIFVEGIIYTGGRIVWFLFVMTCIYILLKALVMLFSDGNKREVTLLAIFLLAIFPYDLLNNSGWVATCSAYLAPIACSVMSLVPIRRAYYGEKIRWWELLIYIPLMIYGTNFEQTSAMMFLIYLTAVVYFLCVKKNRWEVWLFFLLSVGSLIFTLTCPGSYSRPNIEWRYFPQMPMLDVIDKADLGLTSTIKWIFTENNVIVLLLCGTLCYITWKKYEDRLFRLIALVPLATVLGLGPLRHVVALVFPYAVTLGNDSATLGAFTVENMGWGSSVYQFAFLLFVAVCVCIEIMLINDTPGGFVADMALVLAGVASRCIMGFVPSVYASNIRTFTAMVFCFMMVLIHAVSQNRSCFAEGTRIRSVSFYAWWILGAAGFINIAVLAIDAFT